MKRYARDNRENLPKPVERIEISNDHLVLRIVLFIVAVAIAAAAFIYAIRQLGNIDSGWTTIETSGVTDANCSDEFVFSYNIPGGTLRAELTKLQETYGELCLHGYRVFNAEETFSDIGNLASVNQHPNEEVEVDEALYQALELVEKSGSRALYLGPLYDLCSDLFYAAEADVYEVDYYSNSALKTSYADVIVSYAKDEEMVSLELLGNNCVILHVSSDYLSFAQYNSISSYLDFFWMKNAFLIDYLADSLIEKGYTHGSLSSYDGYVRNLDTDQTQFSFNLYEKIDSSVYIGGVISYTSPCSLVYLRNFPMLEYDSYHYREMDDGQIRTSYLNQEDGTCQSAVSSMLSYSSTKSCAEILMEMIPVYISDSLDSNAVVRMVNDDIQTVTLNGTEILYTDPDLILSVKDYSDESTGTGVVFSASLLK